MPPSQRMVGEHNSSPAPRSAPRPSADPGFHSSASATEACGERTSMVPVTAVLSVRVGLGPSARSAEGSAPVQTNTMPPYSRASYIVAAASGSSPVGAPTGGANLLVRSPNPSASAMFSAAEKAATLIPFGMRSSTLRLGIAVQRPVAPSKLQP